MSNKNSGKMPPGRGPPIPRGGIPSKSQNTLSDKLPAKKTSAPTSGKSTMFDFSKMGNAIDARSKNSDYSILVEEMRPLPQGGFVKIDLNPVRRQGDPQIELARLRRRPAHSTDEFKDGFVVNEDQVSMKPTVPYKYPPDANNNGNNNARATRSNAPVPKMVFSFRANPASQNASLDKKIAIVREKKSDEIASPQEYLYRIFTYEDATQSSDLKYVLSGSNESIIPGGHVVSNTFIPLDILHNRLCGTESQRQEAYKRDWLTYCNRKNKRAQVKKSKLSVPTTALPDDLETLVNYDGSHLLARNSIGQFSPEAGAHFLEHLLGDYEDHLITPQNLSRHIFERWCLIAHAAASMEKEPFSVKARFWKLPKVLTGIELIYEIMPGWWENPENPKIWESGNLSDEVKGPLEKLKFKFDTRTKNLVWKTWDDYMKTIFDAAKASANATLDKKPHLDQKVAIPNFRLLNSKDKPAELVEIGSHPQGYYRTFIKLQDKNRLIGAGYKFDPIPGAPTLRPFPKQDRWNDIKSVAGEPKRVLPRDKSPTETAITKANIRVASKWPRICSQNAVMNNVSANDIAAQIWHGPTLDRRSAEWLHRSAYSYGGNGTPDSSQDQRNLVFGTFEANTEMIRYEAYLKRMIDKSPDNRALAVALTTFLNRSNAHPKDIQDIPWLVPYLGYAWTFNLNYALNHDALDEVQDKKTLATKGVNFNLFSQKIPMRYEVEVDEKFDNELRSAPDEIQALVALFLISQSNYVTGDGQIEEEKSSKSRGRKNNAGKQASVNLGTKFPKPNL